MSESLYEEARFRESIVEHILDENLLPMFLSNEVMKKKGFSVEQRRIHLNALVKSYLYPPTGGAK